MHTRALRQMRKRRTSIQDIAKRAGVSHTTVSRALRDNPSISLKVREEIKQLAQEMGYVPNGIAQSLQNQRTNTIGVVVTSIADPFFAEIVEGIEKIAKAASVSVVLSAAHQDVEQEIAAIDNFHRRRVDGIIVADSHMGKQHLKQLAQIAVPTVLLNSKSEELSQFHFVTIDNLLGAQLAVKHLIKLKHTAIGYIGVSNRTRSNQQRLEGYRTALIEANLSQSTDWVAISDAEYTTTSDVDTGQQMLPQLVNAGVTGIFCYNDMVAVGALLACQKLGIAVPQELSLVGFDGIALARYVTPPLTTVRQPMRAMGCDAAQMLLDLLQEKSVENRILSPFLIVGDSSAICSISAGK